MDLKTNGTAVELIHNEWIVTLEHITVEQLAELAKQVRAFNDDEVTSFETAIDRERITHITNGTVNITNLNIHCDEVGSPLRTGSEDWINFICPLLSSVTFSTDGVEQDTYKSLIQPKLIYDDKLMMVEVHRQKVTMDGCIEVLYGKAKFTVEIPDELFVDLTPTDLGNMALTSTSIRKKINKEPEGLRKLNAQSVRSVELAGSLFNIIVEDSGEVYLDWECYTESKPEDRENVRKRVTDMIKEIGLIR